MKEIYEKTRLNEKPATAGDSNSFITRFRAKARLANLVQSRVKLLRQAWARKKNSRTQNSGLRFSLATVHGKYALLLRISPFPPPLWHRSSGFQHNHQVRRQGLRGGRNGKGKDTSFNCWQCLAPRASPITGQSRYRKGFFEQTTIASLVLIAERWWRR